MEDREAPKSSKAKIRPIVVRMPRRAGPEAMVGHLWLAHGETGK